MTDRVSGFYVTLKKKMRQDDAEALKNAILMLRNVIDVTYIDGGTPELMAEARIRNELTEQLFGVLEKKG